MGGMKNETGVSVSRFSANGTPTRGTAHACHTSLHPCILVLPEEPHPSISQVLRTTHLICAFSLRVTPRAVMNVWILDIIILMGYLSTLLCPIAAIWSRFASPNLPRLRTSLLVPSHSLFLLLLSSG
jgi:hypothetical protein